MIKTTVRSPLGASIEGALATILWVRLKARFSGFWETVFSLLYEAQVWKQPQVHDERIGRRSISDGVIH